MFEILLAITLGVFAGTITGLIPGIHINLVSSVLVANVSLLSGIADMNSMCVFIVAMSVVHSFMDVIPSIYLGAPDSATALGVLPGHRYLLRGNGLMAVKLTVLGSYFGLIISVVAFFPALVFIKHIYPVLKENMLLILIAAMIFSIWRDNKRFWALVVFSLSGLLGFVVLRSPAISDPLFPMLSGLFGISTLLISLKESQSIPEQRSKSIIKLKKNIGIKAVISGWIFGFFTAIVPGLGASSAAAVAVQFSRKLGDHGFMILIGAISTVNFVMSVATFYAVSKARNGSIVAVKKLIGNITIEHAMLLSVSGVIAGSIAVYLTIAIARWFSELMSYLNYRYTVIFVIFLIIVMVAFMSGPAGILVLTTSTAVGLVPAIKKVSRTQAMACILVPVTLYFL